MRDAEVLLGLMVAVAALVVLARRTNVPYPAVLVVGGVALAAIPGIPIVKLRPDLIFLLFLPPLLYTESLETPLRELRRNARPIASLAVGLVIASSVAAAAAGRAILPGLGWPAALV